MIRVRHTVHITRRERGRRIIEHTARPSEYVEPGRIPRISRLMALAVHFDRPLREGIVADQTELARLCHVTQPRMTQIMNLNHLAPDIQEELLFLPRVTRGREPIHERMLRRIAANVGWRIQRTQWAKLRRSTVVCQS